MEYKKRVFEEYMMPDKMLYDDKKWIKEEYQKRFEDKINKFCNKHKLNYLEITKIYKKNHVNVLRISFKM